MTERYLFLEALSTGVLFVVLTFLACVFAYAWIELLRYVMQMLRHARAVTDRDRLQEVLTRPAARPMTGMTLPASGGVR